MKSKRLTLVIAVSLTIAAPTAFSSTTMVTFEGTIIGGSPENIGKHYDLIFTYDPIYAITESITGEKQYGGTNFGQVLPNVLTEIVELRVNNISGGQYTGTFYNANIIRREIPQYDPDVSFNYLQIMVLDANRITIAEARINEAALITASELFSNPTFNQTGSYTVQNTYPNLGNALYTNASWNLWGQGFGDIEKVSISSPVPLPPSIVMLGTGLLGIAGSSRKWAGIKPQQCKKT